MKDGYVTKKHSAREEAAKAAGLPRSKHIGVTWHKVNTGSFTTYGIVDTF